MSNSINTVNITKAINDLTKPVTDYVAAEHALNISIKNANKDIKNIQIIDQNNIIVELNNTTKKTNK